MSGAVAYTVSVDADSDFVGATEIRTRSTSLVIPNALTAGDWYWKVSADLGNGISSASSEERRFDVLPLADPVMARPQNNVEVQDVVLDWNPVVGAKSYEIQVARNNDFTTIIETKSGIQGTNYSPVTTYDNAQYFWRVRSVDVNDQSTPWTDARSVFTRTYPDAPILRYPAEGANVQRPCSCSGTRCRTRPSTSCSSGPTSSSPPTPSRSAASPARPTSPFQYAVNRVVLAGPDRRGLPAEHQPDHLLACPPPRPSVQQARRQPLACRASTPPTRTFTYRPPTVTGHQPTGGATVDIPTLSWNPTRSADTYTVTITGPGVNITATTPATSFTPSQKLAAGTYTWTIRATTFDGQQSVLSSHSFVVSGATPAPAGTPLAALSGRASDPADDGFTEPDLAALPGRSPLPSAHRPGRPDHRGR